MCDNIVFNAVLNVIVQPKSARYPAYWERLLTVGSTYGTQRSRAYGERF